MMFRPSVVPGILTNAGTIIGVSRYGDRLAGGHRYQRRPRRDRRR